MPDDQFRAALKVAVMDLRERWRDGAPNGDSYRIGFSAGLWNALSLIEGAAEEAGVDPAEVGMEQGWAD